MDNIIIQGSTLDLTFEYKMDKFTIKISKKDWREGSTNWKEKIIKVKASRVIQMRAAKKNHLTYFIVWIITDNDILHECINLVESESVFAQKGDEHCHEIFKDHKISQLFEYGV